MLFSLYRSHMDVACRRHVTCCRLALLQVVQDEMEHVNNNSDKCMETIGATLDDVMELVQARRREMMHAVQRVCSEKKRVLREQLEIIESEKQRVQAECQGLQSQVEVSVRRCSHRWR